MATTKKFTKYYKFLLLSFLVLGMCLKGSETIKAAEMTSEVGLTYVEDGTVTSTSTTPTTTPTTTKPSSSGTTITKYFPKTGEVRTSVMMISGVLILMVTILLVLKKQRRGEKR